MHRLVEVRLLGPAVVRTADGRTVRPEQWKTVKSRDLLRLLALNHGTVLPVDQVIDALWPDVDTDRGRTSLRTALSHVRRLLGPDAVERVGGGLRLGPAWVDLAVYESRVASAHRAFASGDAVGGLLAAKESVALRPGPLLADDPFAEWAQVPRAHVEQLHGRLLTTAAEVALGAGLFHAALEFGSIALRHDRCAERSARVVMQACVEQGDRATALRVYADLRDALSEELGVRPAPETEVLHQRIDDGDGDGVVSAPADGVVSAPGSAVPATVTAVATAEVELLSARLRGALDQRRGHLAVVSGPAGSDVRTVVAETVARLADSALVLELDPSRGLDVVNAAVAAGSGVLVVNGSDEPSPEDVAALAARTQLSPPTVVLIGCRPSDEQDDHGRHLIGPSPDVTIVRLVAGGPSADPAIADGGPVAMSATFDAQLVLSARIEQARSVLDPEEQELVDLLSVSLGPLPIATLARLAGDHGSIDAALVALAKLDALGLVHTTSEGLQLVAGVADVASGWIPNHRRQELYERLAGDEGLPRDLRGRHLLAAGRAEEAAELFLVAATDVAGRGPSTRSRRLLWDTRHAVARAGLSRDATVGWLRRIAEVAGAAGCTDDAFDALAAAVRLAQGGDAGDGEVVRSLPGARPRRRNAATTGAGGTPAGAGVRSGEGRAGDLAARVQLRVRVLSEQLWPARDLDAIKLLDAELDALPLERLDDVTRAVCDLARIEGAVWAGDGALHVRRLWRIWPVLQSHPDRSVAARSALVLGWALHELDDERFETVWQQAELVALEAGRQRSWEALSVVMATERTDLGRARRHAGKALVVGDVDRPEFPVTLLGIARYQQREGRRDDAVATLAGGLTAARRAGHRLLVPELAARLAVLEAPTSAASAASHLALAESIAGHGRWFARERVWILLAKAALCQAAGDTDEAEDLELRAGDAANSARLVWERAAVAERLADRTTVAPVAARRQADRGTLAPVLK